MKVQSAYLQKSPEKELASIRILIIEDDPLITWHLCADLAAHGAIVYSPRHNAKIAEKLFDTTNILEKVDVAILDANLGNHTSEPVAERLGEVGIPFIFYTGDCSSNSDFIMNIDAPVVTKPSHIDVIVKALRVASTSKKRKDTVTPETVPA